MIKCYKHHNNKSGWFCTDLYYTIYVFTLTKFLTKWFHGSSESFKDDKIRGFTKIPQIGRSTGQESINYQYVRLRIVFNEIP